MEMGKVWVVCGASEGIGPATVNYLLFRKQTVVAISTGAGQGHSAGWQAGSNDAEFRQTDVFKRAEVETAVRQILSKYGRIDRLINIGDAGLLSLRVFTAMQQAGRGHIIQFTAAADSMAGNDAAKATTIQSVCAETEGVHYTLIDPGIFFQSTLFNQPERYLS